MTTTGDGATALGLRERKKLRTRREIADAAIRLAVDRGLDHVTVDQIAAAAEIAPRTFFRYFDSKEDALLADHPERLALLRVSLRNRPADEGPLTAVRAAILEVAGDLEDHRELMLCKARLMEDNPNLRGRSLEMMGELERTIAEELAQRMQVDVDHDLRPFVIAGAVASAMRVAVDRWAATGGDDDLQAAVVEALDLLDGGLDRSVAGARGAVD
jgi:AcrR family transcriptional regulator